jgi:hypothetical protein
LTGDALEASRAAAAAATTQRAEAAEAANDDDDDDDGNDNNDDDDDDDNEGVSDVLVDYGVPAPYKGVRVTQCERFGRAGWCCECSSDVHLRFL